MDMQPITKESIESFLYQRNKALSFDAKKHIYYINGKQSVGVSEFLSSRWYRIKPELFLKHMRFESGEEEVRTLLAWQLKGHQATLFGTYCHDKLEQFLKGKLGLDDIEPFFAPIAQFCRETYQGCIVLSEQRYYDETIGLCGTADVTIVDTVNKVLKIHDFKVVGGSLCSTFHYFSEELENVPASKRLYYSLQLGCYYYLATHTLSQIIPDIHKYKVEAMLLVARKDIYEKQKGSGNHHFQQLLVDETLFNFAFNFLFDLSAHKKSVIDLLQLQSDNQ
jgi:hypothetical protein